MPKRDIRLSTPLRQFARLLQPAARPRTLARSPGARSCQAFHIGLMLLFLEYLLDRRL
jgi:hypothetical protein